MTIDDAGFAANSGVTIYAPAGLVENLAGGNRSVAINAVNGSNDFIAFQGGTGSAIAIGGGVGTIALTASGSISLSANTTLGNDNTDTPWVVTAPLVKLNDGSSLNTTGSIGIGSGSASLAIHTNNLNLGDGSNGNPTLISADGLSIDDNGGNVFATTGLTITTEPFITSNLKGGSGTITISTGAQSNLLFTPMPPFNAAHSVLTLDAAGGVMLDVGNAMTIQSGLTVENTTSSSNWTVTANGVYIYSVAAIDLRNGATIAFNVNTLGLIEPAYPQQLDLSLTNPTLNIPAVPSGISIGQEGGISGQNVTINGQSQGSFLGSGQYGVASYSVTIAGGNGPLTITPTTNVTPAEWVAAEQVAYGTGSNPQTLNIGANNAASGGNFTVASANLPSGGFSSIVILGTTSGITMNVSVPTIQTNSLENNGVIAPSGGQTNLTITSVGTTTGNLQVSGSGTFNFPTGTVNLQTPANGALTIADQTSLAITGAFMALLHRLFYVGTEGTVGGTVNSSGAMTFHTNALNLGVTAVLTGRRVDD